MKFRVYIHKIVDIFESLKLGKTLLNLLITLSFQHYPQVFPQVGKESGIYILVYISLSDNNNYNRIFSLIIKVTNDFPEAKIWSLTNKYLSVRDEKIKNIVFAENFFKKVLILSTRQAIMGKRMSIKR